MSLNIFFILRSNLRSNFVSTNLNLLYNPSVNINSNLNPNDDEVDNHIDEDRDHDAPSNIPRPWFLISGVINEEKGCHDKNCDFINDHHYIDIDPFVRSNDDNVK